MQEISHLDPQISEFYEQLLSVEDLLNGFHQELTTYMENMEFDEQTYQEVEERLNVINSLKANMVHRLKMLQHMDKRQKNDIICCVMQNMRLKY